MTTKATADGDTDPFELPDTLQLGPPINPYPHVAEALRRNPVQRAWPLPMDTALGPEGMLGDDENINAFSVLGYEELAAVFRDGETYSSALIGEAIGPLLAHTMVAMDGSEHRAHRALVAPAFRPKFISHWESEIVAPIAHQLIDSFVGLGAVDLVRRFTFALPVRVITQIFGVPQKDVQKFQRWSIEMISIPLDWDRGMAAFEALRGYFSEQVEQRRREPRGDLITELAEAEVNGQRLTDEEIFAFLRLLLPAGVETTYRSLGNLLFALLTHPDQLAEVRDNPGAHPRRDRGGPTVAAADLPHGSHQHKAQPARRHGHTFGRLREPICRGGQPRRTGLRQPRRIRCAPRPQPADCVRGGGARVPRCAPRPHGEPDRAASDPEAAPRSTA